MGREPSHQVVVLILLHHRLLIIVTSPLFMLWPRSCALQAYLVQSTSPISWCSQPLAACTSVPAWQACRYLQEPVIMHAVLS